MRCLGGQYIWYLLCTGENNDSVPVYHITVSKRAGESNFKVSKIVFEMLLVFIASLSYVYFGDTNIYFDYAKGPNKRFVRLQYSAAP